MSSVAFDLFIVGRLTLSFGLNFLVALPPVCIVFPVFLNVTIDQGITYIFIEQFNVTCKT